MATPYYGQVMIRGDNGILASRICYGSDTAINLVFDSGSGSPTTGGTDYLQFTQGWTIYDISLGAVATMKSIRLVVNGVNTMFTLAPVVHLNSNAARPPLNLHFGPTERVSLLQVA